MELELLLAHAHLPKLISEGIYWSLSVLWLLLVEGWSINVLRLLCIVSPLARSTRLSLLTGKRAFCRKTRRKQRSLRLRL